MQNNDIFEVVLTTKAKAKNGTSSILIESSVKGLIYRSEVYMDDHLIDAVEVNCSDISTVDRYEEVFQARYSAAHKKFEALYTQERVYTKVLTAEGDYSEGEGVVNVVTSISDTNYKVEAFLDSQQIDIKQEELDEDVDPKVFKAKYTQVHKDFVSNYISVPRFPANTFLNPVIKKFPMYKKSPMYAFVFFLLTLMFVLWLISLLLCGKAMKKIVAKVAGKEAGMIVKDLQKGMCSKSGPDEGDKVMTGSDGSVVVMKVDDEGNTQMIKKSGAKVPDFVFLPKVIEFKDARQIEKVHIKNNLPADVLIRIKDRIIFDFEDALVSPDMVVNVITKDALHIKSQEVGVLEFKLESAFLQSSSLEERSYHGSIVVDATNLQNSESQLLTIGFDFTVTKDTKEEMAE